MASDFWSSSHCSTWLLDRKMIETSNSKDTELFSAVELKILKIHFLNLIQIVARKMNLRQRIAATASVFFKRFYVKNSFLEFDPRLVVPTSLYLSTKAEECLTQAKTFALAMKMMDSNYKYDMNDILECEFYLLEDIGFHLIVFHPYKSLLPFAYDSDSVDCLDRAWSIINDSYLTDVSLLYPPHIIALSALFLSSFISGKDLTAWFSELDVDMKDIWETTQEILNIYEFLRTTSIEAEPLTKKLFDKIDDIISKTKSSLRNSSTIKPSQGLAGMMEKKLEQTAPPPPGPKRGRSARK
eukprot:TRINITY_DN1070_c0_g1_i2.p1 TRINITY_DN1070_c0_g1~~TRINITY_DN1070_c0_g1_i2.p1  ORF type:complete len:298 (-),score=60.52 TRINITY_DN1070_c0_g1_i2:194-1087(-)